MSGTSRSDEIGTRVIGCSGGRVAVAVTNPFAGRRARYTMWSLAMNGLDVGAGTPFVLGRELTLKDCRSAARKAGYR